MLFTSVLWKRHPKHFLSIYDLLSKTIWTLSYKWFCWTFSEYMFTFVTLFIWKIFQQGILHATRECTKPLKLKETTRNIMGLQPTPWTSDPMQTHFLAPQKVSFAQTLTDWISLISLGSKPVCWSLWQGAGARCGWWRRWESADSKEGRGQGNGRNQGSLWRHRGCSRNAKQRCIRRWGQHQGSTMRKIRQQQDMDRETVMTLDLATQSSTDWCWRAGVPAKATYTCKALSQFCSAAYREKETSSWPLQAISLRPEAWDLISLIISAYITVNVINANKIM